LIQQSIDIWASDTNNQYQQTAATLASFHLSHSWSSVSRSMLFWWSSPCDSYSRIIPSHNRSS
jgi:hypothetical protein